MIAKILEKEILLGTELFPEQGLPFSQLHPVGLMGTGDLRSRLFSGFRRNGWPLLGRQLLFSCRFHGEYLGCPATSTDDEKKFFLPISVSSSRTFMHQSLHLFEKSRTLLHNFPYLLLLKYHQRTVIDLLSVIKKPVEMLSPQRSK